MKLEFFIINRNILLLFLCSLCCLLALVLNNFIFSLLAIFLCLSDSIKTLPHLLLMLMITLFFSTIELLTAKNFFVMVFSIILFSSKFGSNVTQTLRIYSLLFFPLIVYMLTLPQIYGDMLDVLKFQQRLWVISPNEVEFNPNTIGVWAAICSLGFFVNRNFYLLIPSVYILLLTQSRSAIVFLLIAILFSKPLTKKTFFSIVFFMIMFIFIIYITPLSKRFLEDGENGRFERIFLFYDYLKQNYLTGIKATEYNYLVEKFSTLDNMYLLILLRYGIFGVFFVLYLFIMMFFNKKDQYYHLRWSIFLGIMVLGLFEGGVVANIALYMVLSVCFNSFSIYRFKHS